MKELFLHEIPTGTTTLGYRIFKQLETNADYILSEGLYKMVKEMPNTHIYKAQILGIHIKRTNIRIRKEHHNPYSCGGVDCVHKFHF